MKVAVGFDHCGAKLRSIVLDELRVGRHEVIDVGTHTDEAEVDFPGKADEVAHLIVSAQAERGILVGSSGVGVTIAANKIRGVRACLCHDVYSARQGVEHDNMNVLCLGADIIGSFLARELIQSFLDAEFDGAEPHRRRLGMIEAIENRQQENA